MFKLTTNYDGKGKQQSYNCIVESDSKLHPFYYEFYLDSYGKDFNEALEECVDNINDFIVGLIEFRDSIKDLKEE